VWTTATHKYTLEGAMGVSRGFRGERDNTSSSSSRRRTTGTVRGELCKTNRKKIFRDFKHWREEK
jgi:hypothetical protein